jgi:membrane protease YdiL (CAAX protease family)
MMTVTNPVLPVSAVTARRTGRSWIASHPVASFFVGAYLISWLFWAPAMLGYTDGAWVVVFFVGVFGPFASAAYVTHATGGSVRGWLRAIFRVRIDRRWYLAALAFPPVLMAVVGAEFAALGESLDFSLAGERLGSYLPLLVVCILLNGGPEEPGWRGFALPHLQERLSPVRSTLLLGFIWALWHLPVLAFEDDPRHGLSTLAFIGILAFTVLGIMLYAFTYTFLWNKTHSALACVLLHASYNTAIGVMILRPDSELEKGTYVLLQTCLNVTLLAVAIALVYFTRGRLGRSAERPVEART